MNNEAKEQVTPSPEEAEGRWRQLHERLGVEGRYADYVPAYRIGHEGYRAYGSMGRTFAEVAGDLANLYEAARTNPRLSWAEVQRAAQAAWEQTEEDE